MKRVLLWLMVTACIWEAFVYLYSRPRFWLRLVQACTWIGTGALHIHRTVAEDQERRTEQWEEFNRTHRARAAGGPRTGDTVTDIEAYLRRKRSP